MFHKQVDRGVLGRCMAGVLFSALTVASSFAEPATKPLPTEVKAHASVSSAKLKLQAGKYAKVLFMAPDGSLLVMSSMASGQDNQLHGIKSKDGSFAWTRKTEGMGAGAFAVAPDGKSFFVRYGNAGHFVSVATGAELGKVKLGPEHYYGEQIAAFTPDGTAVILFYPTKTQRIDVAARQAGPVVKLTPPGENGRFRGTYTHIAGTDLFLLAEYESAAVFQLKMGTTEFKQVMQLPTDKAAYNRVYSNNGRDYWALYQWEEAGRELVSWGVHTADGTRGKQFDPALPYGLIAGGPEQLGASSRAAFGTQHGLRVGLVYDADKSLDSAQAILLGEGDPYGFVASKDGTSIAGVTRQGDVLFWTVPAE